MSNCLILRRPRPSNTALTDSHLLYLNSLRITLCGRSPARRSGVDSLNLLTLCAEHARPLEEDLCQLMRDCSVMIGLHHENLSPVMAACLDGQLGRPVKLVYLASTDDDNLKLFLQQCRHSQVCGDCHRLRLIRLNWWK